MKKKITTILIAIMLFMAMSLNAAASYTPYTYTIENKTIRFNPDTTFDETTREYIANYLAYGTHESTTYGLTCTLLGHTYEASLVTTITHCASDTNPRCLEETYKVQICSRCDHTTTRLINSHYITCCPEE